MRKIKKDIKCILIGLMCIASIGLVEMEQENQVVKAAWGGWSYNPGWSAGGESSVSNACQILKSEGLTAIAAAGVIGNFMAESSMNPYKREGVGNHASYGPDAINLDPDMDSFGPGRGLAQWGDGTGRNGRGSSRWLTLVNYVNSRYGKSYPAKPSAAWNNSGNSDQNTVKSQWPTLEEQLAFVKKELADGDQGLTLAGYNGATTPEEAAYLFAAKYERPGNLAGSISHRKTEARKAYQNHCNKEVVLPIKNYARMDSFTYEKGLINARGWAFNTDLQPTLPEHRVAISYVAFLMDADKGVELARTQEGFHYRNDVANVFSRFKNVGYGGFQVKFRMQQSWEGKNTFIMIRFANDAAGNLPRVDDNYQMRSNILRLPRTDAALDILNITSQGIHARGWQLSPTIAKHRYLFIMDKMSGLELGRVKISNIPRADVAHLYPQYPIAGESGFDVTLPIQSNWRGKEIFVMVRYTDDEAGNEAISDSPFINSKLLIPNS